MIVRSDTAIVDNLLISGTVYGCLAFIHVVLTTFFGQPYTVKGGHGAKTKTRSGLVQLLARKLARKFEPGFSF